MEKISSMNLTPEQWPYRDARIIVLSNTVKEPPENLKDKVEMYSGDLLELITILDREGFIHAYVDGGKTIQSFLNLKLINEMTLTQIPVLLGEGKALFGKTNQDIRLEKSEAIAFPNDCVQVHYGDWAILEWKDPKGLRGCGFFYIVDDHIVFQRGYFNELSFLRQQGLPLPTK